MLNCYSLNHFWLTKLSFWLLHLANFIWQTSFGETFFGYANPFPGYTLSMPVELICFRQEDKQTDIHLLNYSIDTYYMSSFFYALQQSLWAIIFFLLIFYTNIYIYGQYQWIRFSLAIHKILFFSLEFKNISFFSLEFKNISFFCKGN